MSKIKMSRKMKQKMKQATQIYNVYHCSDYYVTEGYFKCFEDMSPLVEALRAVEQCKYDQDDEHRMRDIAKQALKQLGFDDE